MTLNQRVPGSSPGAPTIQSPQTARFEDNRSCKFCCLCRKARSSAGRSEYGYLMLNQIGDQGRQSIIMAFRPTVLDLYVLAVDISGILQTLHEGGHGRVTSARLASFDQKRTELSPGTVLVREWD